MKVLSIYLLVTISGIISFENSASCAGKKWFTFPNSSTIPPSKPQPINPGSEIPSDRAKRSWQITSKTLGVATGSGNGAPAYLFSNIYGLSFVGFVPEGTEIKLETVDTFAKIHYYRMPRPASLVPDETKGKRPTPTSGGKGIKGEFVWISGNNIVAK
jgi:hypothetical protein